MWVQRLDSPSYMYVPLDLKVVQARYGRSSANGSNWPVTLYRLPSIPGHLGLGRSWSVKSNVSLVLPYLAIG